MKPDSLAPAPRPPRRKAGRVLKGTLFAILLVLVAALSLVAGFYVAVARTLPTLQLPEDIATAQTTRIYDDSDQPVLLAELHGLENREVLPSEQMPQLVRDAVVALEDERFYEHGGVDFVAILRAAWANATHGEIVQGASTITQQLIKNAFLTNEKTVDRKFREAALAYQLEKRWSKQKILDEYLNIIYYGEGAYGIEAAARTYFGVHAAQLTLPQAALLAGLPQAPSAYSPRRNPDAALARRDVCLNKMYQQGYITSGELQEALAEPLQLADAKSDTAQQVPYWIEMVREQLVSRYGSSQVLGGGLRVYLSVDLALQKQAEASIAQILDQPDDPSAALVCIDVHTGRLLAMVGGSDFAKMQFNLATQGRRQPGSAFKPFVLVNALQNGMSPDTTYASGPFSVDLADGPWDVSSTDEGPLTLTQATAESSNGVYARLIMDLGAGKVAQTAYDMGITTSLGTEPNPAIALGGLTTGVSPLEMAMAYATLATGGERLEAQPAFDESDPAYPVTIVRVTDADGKELDESAVARTRVLDPDVAAMATSCLERVITSGTGTAADIGRPAAGKTGTTTDYCDAWFVGYTPDLVTAVWVGYPTERKPMTDVHGKKVTGGSLPAQIWAAFMKTAVAELPESDFQQPSYDGWESVEVCGESHKLPTEFCPTKVMMHFRPSDVPTEQCTVHVAQEIAVPDLVGMSLADALTALTTAHFVFASVDDPTSSKPAGTVVSQQPAAGEMLMQGSTVTLTLSTGESLRVVPALLGLDITTARTKLAAAGLLSSESIVADPSAPGTVLSQDPVDGFLPAGASVVLVISGGPETPSQ
jgi:penicillin-binding protein 1A